MKELLISDDKLIDCPICKIQIIKANLAVQDKLIFNCPKCNCEILLKRRVYG